MKFTIYRKDKNNKKMISTRPVEQIINRMKSNKKNTICEVWPNVEMRRDANGVPVIRRLNGVIVLTFDNLPEAERREAVKEAAMTLPTTLAAFNGDNGRSVVVLVRYPVGIKDFELADRLADTAYEDAIIIYTRVTGAEVCYEQPSARMTFTMVYDEHPLYNADAIPLDRNANGEETMLIIRLLNSRYHFRFNTLFDVSG